MKRVTVGIAGLGLIGGSLGLALKASSAAMDQPGDAQPYCPGVPCGARESLPNWHVLGYDPDPRSRAAALGRGAVVAVEASLGALAQRADLLVIAAPTTQIAQVAITAAPYMKRGSTITDCGSVKATVLTAVSGALPDHVRFIGGHPMAGSEKSGVENASPNLFHGASWAICRAHPEIEDAAGTRSLEIVRSMVRATGASVFEVSAEEHDRSVAFTSHLPYIVSVLLALASREESFRTKAIHSLHGRAFRDMTRIARADPEMPLDYCLANRSELTQALKTLSRLLEDTSERLARHDDEAIVETAKHALGFLLSSQSPDQQKNGR